MHLMVARLAALALVLAADSPPAASPPSSVLELATTGGSPLRVRRAAVAPVSALAFSPDGRTLASGGYGEVLLWDVAAGRVRSRLGGEKARIQGPTRAIVYLDAGTLAVAAEGKGPVLLDAASGAARPTLKDPLDDVVALARGGGLIAAGSSRGQVGVWKPSGEPVARIDLDSGAVDLSFSPDGALLAVATTDRRLNLHRTSDWGRERWLSLDGPPTAAAFSPDGATLAICVGGPVGRGVRIRVKEAAEPATKAERKAAAASPAEPFASPPRKIDLGGGLPVAAAFHPRNGRLYVALADHAVRVVTPGGAVANTLRGHAESVAAVAVDPDGLFVATAGVEGTIKLWNGRDDALAATLVPLERGTDGWLVATPKGEFDASSPGVVIDDAAAKRAPAPEAVHRVLESIRPAPPPAPRPAEVKKAERPGRKKPH